MSGTYTTKELSPATWPDFADLFSRGNGWDFCACMFFPRGGHLPSKEFPHREDMGPRNLAEKHDLVREARAHGVLVYDPDGRAVGWCQYGPVIELPLDAPPPGPGEPSWRITCFVTEK